MASSGGKPEKGAEELVAADKILVREGSDPRLSQMIFKTVVQAVLLLWSETWVLTPRMEWALGSFQHRFAQRITSEG